MREYLNDKIEMNRFQLKYIDKDTHYKLEIVRKDLLINTNSYLIFIDTSKTEDITIDNVRYVDKKFDIHFTDVFPQNKNQSLNQEEFVYQKTINGNFILYKSCIFNNVVILLNIFNPHSKLSSNNDLGFNIKVPIIFISIIIIAIYQYNKKKNEGLPENADQAQMKDEMMEQIRMMSKKGKMVKN